MQTSPGIINNTKEYSIVRLTRERLKDLARLHSAVYAPVPDDYYFKKYNTAYTGVEYVGFIAYQFSLPIAFYGVIPSFIQYKNTRVLAAQSADTMTHPAYRLKGMFMDLSNKTFALCRQLGIQLVYGFPNQNSYHGALKLGWKETEKMDCFLLRVNTLPLKSLADKSSLLRNIYKQYSQSILKKYQTNLKGVASAAGFAGVERSTDYLEYKTYSDTKVIQIGSAKVWASFKNAFVIGDIEGVKEENFISIMRVIEKLARKLGIRQIQFHTSPGTHSHGLFSKEYKAVPSFPVLFQDFGSPIPLEKIKFTFADIDVF